MHMSGRGLVECERSSSMMVQSRRLFSLEARDDRLISSYESLT